MNKALANADIDHLSVALEASQRTWAVLLGSGISRSASIPTGWEVVRSLVLRLAASKGSNVSNNWEAWYRETYDEDPDYSSLIEKLAPKQAERQQLLQEYFEPTEEERGKGLKVPTAAHQNIAKLVKLGVIRVIITTNFDRLMEQALQQEDVKYDLISSEDNIKGMRPLAHSNCAVIKLHGDYRDTRIRNTSGELESYPPLFDQLLDRIFDEFGCLICGWSGNYDPALRKAIERRSSRRYHMYWVSKGQPSDLAMDLIANQDMSVLNTAGADELFSSLANKVEALRTYRRTPIATEEAVVAQAKHNLESFSGRIRLHQLCIDEANRLYDFIGQEVKEGAIPSQLIPSLVDNAKLTMKIAANIAYWGDDWADNSLFTLIDRLAANPPGPSSGNTDLIKLRWLCAHLVFYAAGVGAIAGGNEKRLVTLIYRESSSSTSALGDETYYYALLNSSTVQSARVAGLYDIDPKHFEHQSETTNQLVSIAMEGLIPEDSIYQDYFDRFETFLATAWIASDGTVNPPKGLYLTRVSDPFSDRQKNPVGAMLDEVTRLGEQWPPLTHGLANRDLSKLKSTLSALNDRRDKVRANLNPFGRM